MVFGVYEMVVRENGGDKTFGQSFFYVLDFILNSPSKTKRPVVYFPVFPVIGFQDKR